MASDGGNDEYALIANLYDHVGLYRDRLDSRFYVEEATKAGSPVLELGCGTGRVLIPTARAGIEIVGLDSSPHMLSICRQQVEKEDAAVQSRIRLVEGDMRDFSLPQKFTLATIPFRPFQHLTTVADQLACLACIRRHLVPDGLLIFDLFNPSLDSLVNKPIGEETDEEPEFFTPDGRKVVRRHKTVAQDRFNQVNQYELVYYVSNADGTVARLVQSFALRYLFRFEAEHLLARGGFALEHVYAGFDRSAYGSKYPGELILVVRRT